MTLKRALTLLLIGFLVGATAGVGYAYRERVQREADSAAVPGLVPSTLMLVCSDGKTPRVQVTWDPKITSAMGGLEKSSDGSTWSPVFTEGESPHASGYTDENIKADMQYYYRVRLREGDPYIQAVVSTDPKTCQ